MRAIDADKLKQTIGELDVECSEYVVSIKEIYKLRDSLYKLSNDKWDKWESFERSGRNNEYLLGKAHAYSIVVDMINVLLEYNLGDDTNA